MAFASRDFLVLVLIAFLIALPIAWFWMREWLNTFAYHINMSWTVFVIAGLMSITIALATVSYQSIKVALINPAKTLRNE